MRLAHKYFLAFAGLATSGFVALASANAVTNYRENLARIAAYQQEEGKVIATQIAAYLDLIAMQLREVNALPWTWANLNGDDERLELHRLLKLNPAIQSIRSIGADGLERRSVSRTAPDDAGQPRIASREFALTKPGITYGAAYFIEGSTPFVTVTVKGGGAQPSLLVAELSLRYVADLVSAARVGDGGRAYITDQRGQLVAHPNLSMVHRQMDLSALEQVQVAHSSVEPTRSFSMFATSPETSLEVLTSATSLAPLGWTLFVEQPVDEVLKPVRASLHRTLWILGGLLLIGLLMSRWLAQRLTRPILELHRGAMAIGAGKLSERISIGGQDELASLGREFNAMTERLDESYRDLETRVRARTQEVASASDRLHQQAIQLTRLNGQLEQSVQELGHQKEEAERANAAKTRFLAAASHDLRQPMQAISLLVEILRERIQAGENAALVAKVQQSVQALESLFVSLLDLSQLDAGAVKPNPVPFRVSSLFALVESTFLPQAIDRGIDLRIAKCSATVLSDPALLARIISNLVANAIHHTLTGGVVVGCRRKGSTLTILVVDTGPGIPEHLHNEIFEEFYQISRPTRDRSHGLGLGLGLSIVKRTAEILGHPLFLRSRLDHGSAFGIVVPLVLGERGALDLIAQRDEELLDIRGTFILVIDDDLENCYAIETLCAQWGCHVVSGSSAEQALESLHTHLRVPDVVITDYRLGGGVLGIDALQMVRGRLEDRLPAIVMTGDLSFQGREIAQDGQIIVLHKPINAQLLRQSLHRLVTRAQATTPRS